MINVNEYFEGKIKSLGFNLDGVDYTVGVMSPGEFTFTIETTEHITGTLGEFEIRLPGQNWKPVKLGDTVVVPAKTTFGLRIKKTTSYVCKYPEGFKRSVEPPR